MKGTCVDWKIEGKQVFTYSIIAFQIIDPANCFEGIIPDLNK